MVESFARRLFVLGAVAALVLALPGTASATVRGGCQVTGSSTSSGTVDITTAAEWHMKSTDTAGGQGTAPSPQKASSVGAYALGIRLPIANGSGNGSTSGSIEGVSVELYAILGKHFVVAGSSDSCSGEIDVILDDVDALFTLFGGGGLLLAAIALLALFMLARRQASCLSRLFGGLTGLLGGAGLSLGLEQFDVLDPQLPIGLGILIVAVLIGLWTPGMLASGTPSAPAPPPAAPPPPDPAMVRGSLLQPRAQPVSPAENRMMEAVDFGGEMIEEGTPSETTSASDFGGSDNRPAGGGSSN